MSLVLFVASLLAPAQAEVWTPAESMIEARALHTSTLLQNILQSINLTLSNATGGATLGQRQRAMLIILDDD